VGLLEECQGEKKIALGDPMAASGPRTLQKGDGTTAKAFGG